MRVPLFSGTMTTAAAAVTNAARRRVEEKAAGKKKHKNRAAHKPFHVVAGGTDMSDSDGENAYFPLYVNCD
jgi:hypothetical protein